MQTGIVQNRLLKALASVLILGGAIVAVYGRAADAPFFFDDSPGIVANPSIKQLWPLWAADRPTPLNPPKELPTSGRPLVNVSFAINHHFNGFEPAGYRVVNMVLHLCSALLLLAIIQRTLRLERSGGRFDEVAWHLALL